MALATAAALAIVPLYFATPREGRLGGLTFAALTTAVAAGVWLLLPGDYLIARAAPALENERLIARSEGLTEVVAVTEAPSQGRTLSRTATRCRRRPGSRSGTCARWPMCRSSPSTIPRPSS
jgi:hypothetical protein